MMSEEPLSLELDLHCGEAQQSHLFGMAQPFHVNTELRADQLNALVKRLSYLESIVSERKAFEQAPDYDTSLPPVLTEHDLISSLSSLANDKSLWSVQLQGNASSGKTTLLVQLYRAMRTLGRIHCVSKSFQAVLRSAEFSQSVKTGDGAEINWFLAVLPWHFMLVSEKKSLGVPVVVEQRRTIDVVNAMNCVQAEMWDRLQTRLGIARGTKDGNEATGPDVVLTHCDLIQSDAELHKQWMANPATGRAVVIPHRYFRTSNVRQVSMAPPSAAELTGTLDQVFFTGFYRHPVNMPVRSLPMRYAHAWLLTVTDRNVAVLSFLVLTVGMGFFVEDVKTAEQIDRFAAATWWSAFALAIQLPTLWFYLQKLGTWNAAPAVTTLDLDCVVVCPNKSIRFQPSSAVLRAGLVLKYFKLGRLYRNKDLIAAVDQADDLRNRFNKVPGTDDGGSEVKFEPMPAEWLWTICGAYVWLAVAILGIYQLYLITFGE